MDFESAMLCGILAQLNVTGPIHLSANSGEILSSDRFVIGALQPIRLATLAEVSGIPRETARCKLEVLCNQGKVEWTADGLWIVSRTGVNDEIRAFTKETVVRLLRTAREIENIFSRT